MIMEYGHLSLKAPNWIRRGEEIKEQLGDTDNKPSVCNTGARTSKMAKSSVLEYYIF